MKITIEPTQELIQTPHGLARAWRGTTDKGTPIIAGVICIGVATDDEKACAELAAELIEVPPGMFGDPVIAIATGPDEGGRS